MEGAEDRKRREGEGKDKYEGRIWEGKHKGRPRVGKERDISSNSPTINYVCLNMVETCKKYILYTSHTTLSTIV